MSEPVQRLGNGGNVAGRDHPVLDATLRRIHATIRSGNASRVDSVTVQISTSRPRFTSSTNPAPRWATVATSGDPER